MLHPFHVHHLSVYSVLQPESDLHLISFRSPSPIRVTSFCALPANLTVVMLWTMTYWPLPLLLSISSISDSRVLLPPDARFFFLQLTSPAPPIYHRFADPHGWLVGPSYSTVLSSHVGRAFYQFFVFFFGLIIFFPILLGFFFSFLVLAPLVLLSIIINI